MPGSVFVLVDDEQAKRSYIPEILRDTVERDSGGRYRVVVIQNVNLKGIDAQEKVRSAVAAAGEDMIGVLIDLVQQYPKDQRAGGVLLDNIKSDPQLRDLDVVIWTGTDIVLSADDVANLECRGAKKVLRRRLTGAVPAHVQLAEQVFDAFGIAIPWRRQTPVPTV